MRGGVLAAAAAAAPATTIAAASADAVLLSLRKTFNAEARTRVADEQLEHAQQRLAVLMRQLGKKPPRAPGAYSRHKYSQLAPDGWPESREHLLKRALREMPEGGIRHDVLIEEDMCGLLIGSKGARIDSAIDKCGLHAMYIFAQEGAPPEEPEDTRIVALFGEPEAIEQAIAYIKGVVKVTFPGSMGRMMSGGRFGGSRAEALPPEGQEYADALRAMVLLFTTARSGDADAMRTAIAAAEAFDPRAIQGLPLALRRAHERLAELDETHEVPKVDYEVYNPANPDCSDDDDKPAVDSLSANEIAAAPLDASNRKFAEALGQLQGLSESSIEHNRRVDADKGRSTPNSSARSKGGGSSVKVSGKGGDKGRGGGSGGKEYGTGGRGGAKSSPPSKDTSPNNPGKAGGEKAGGEKAGGQHKEKRDAERRIDPSDGKGYYKWEYRKYYGAATWETRWNSARAAPAEDKEASVAAVPSGAKAANSKAVFGKSNFEALLSTKADKADARKAERRRIFQSQGFECPPSAEGDRPSSRRDHDRRSPASPPTSGGSAASGSRPTSTA